MGEVLAQYVFTPFSSGYFVDIDGPGCLSGLCQMDRKRGWGLVHVG